MKKILKPVLIILAVILIIIQFIHPDKNVSTANSVSPNEISYVFKVPEDVHNILQTSCYDCHSNNTQYPWYSHIQPVAGWLNDHILEGKKEINFSEFSTYSIRRKYKKMEEIIEMVKEDEMPLYSYTLIHRNALLSEDQKAKLTGWAKSIRDTMKATYPADSLKRK